MSALEEFTLRPPSVEDGMGVYRLIERCPPLDPNSSYCNLLQCSHFARTSVLAEINGATEGFISAYVVPDHPNTLFVWQVAVSESVRGCGLASSMLNHILERENLTAISHVETTITESNDASRALFQRLASKLGAALESEPWMDQERHFDGQHDSETLVRIGPFKTSNVAKKD